MSKITRQGSNQILSTAVEYHNFVFLAGLTADDLAKDVTGQTYEVIAKIDAALEANGTDKTRLFGAAKPMASMPVAQMGYGGFRNNKRVIVAGALNKTLVGATRVAPRGLLLRTVRHLQGTA